MTQMMHPAVMPGENSAFNESEIADFLAKGKTRDEEGRGWDGLFAHARQALYDIQGDHIRLPLYRGDEAVGVDARLSAVLRKHNQAAKKAYDDAAASGKTPEARPEYCIFAPHKSDKTLLKRYFGGKLQSRDTKLISFLHSKDDAQCHLLAHDLTVEWGHAEKEPVASSFGDVRDFAAVKNSQPLSADSFDPESLRVVISRDPMDIARMSTGRRWTSCMAKGRENYRYVQKEIEAGTLVAYLAHKDDTTLAYPLMRVLLKPFHNDRGESILVPNHVYGADKVGSSQMHDLLLGTLKHFVATHVNSGKTGQFTMHQDIYSDGQEKSVTLGGAIDSGKLAKAIARAIPDKVKEYVTEIEAAHKAGNATGVKIYTAKLADIFAAPEIAGLAYLRNLRAMHTPQALPKPSEVVKAMQSEAVRNAQKEADILAQLYLKGKGFGAFMQKNYPARTHLSLAGYNVADVGAATLALSKTLTWLEVHSNQIGDIGAEALAKNTTLTALYLGSNKIGDEGAKALAANTTLSFLTVDWNQIGDVGAKALAANTNLVLLGLSNMINDTISDVGTRAIIEGLKKNKNLLEYHGPGQNDVKEHCAENRRQAHHYANLIVDSHRPPFTAEDKVEIGARANAIRYLLGECMELNADEKQTALKILDALVKPQHWVDRTEARTPRIIG